MTVTEVYLGALLKCLADDYAALYAAAARGQTPDPALDPAHSTACHLVRQAVAGLEARQANSPAKVQS